MKRLILPIVLIFFAANLNAESTVIDFDSFEREDAVFQEIGNEISEDGFVISVSGGSALGNVGTMETRYSGSAAIASLQVGSLYVLTRATGGAFGISSIDLAEFSTGAGPTAPAVTFTGIRSGGGIATQTFVLDGQGFAPQEFNFDSDFSNLVGLVWAQTSPSHQFDNLNVNAIPEPSALCLLAGGIALIASRRRR